MGVKENIEAHQKFVGFCIYCGDTGTSDEHALSYWLGGKHVILKGSCEACARVINQQIENKLSRGPFWSARRHLKLPSRGGHKCPLPVELRDGGVARLVKISEADNPGLLWTLSLPGPRILEISEPQESSEFEAWLIMYCFNEEQRQRFARRHPSEIIVSPYINWDALGRLIAKIALGVAVLQFGVHAFRPLVRETILVGGNSLCQFYVGMSDAQGPRHLKLHDWDHQILEVRGVRYLAVDIQLFAHWGMPNYRVFVGEVVEPMSDAQMKEAWTVA